MADVMKEDEAFHPAAVRAFCAGAVVAGAECLGEAVEEFGLLAERADAGWGGNER
jgi:hypothetical protein